LARPLLKPLTQPTAASRQAYIISGLGGHALQFRPLANLLLPDWHLTGILYPVFAGGENTCSSITELAIPLRAALEEEKGPLVLIGYSFGGAIAYQMAAELRAQGRQVAVILIDTSIRSLRRRPRRFARGLRNLFYKKPRRILAKLRSGQHPQGQQGQQGARAVWKPKDASVAEFVEESRRAMRIYAPPRSDVPIVLIRAASHYDWTLWLDGKFWPSPTHGWSRVAPVAGVVRGPGDHFKIIAPENTAALAMAMDDALVMAFSCTG